MDRVQRRRVEFRDFDFTFVAQSAQRPGIVDVRLGQRARVFSGSDSLDELPVIRVEAFPDALVSRP
jgi:hypothetical protein